ncbi:DUF998 domain-containing protein [Kribbella sp. NBC_01505]|uniref:DUF998 domain-containing protein n=1 Tax=Kribbella sp. NBC_01505 TaxID=2903580 RepID=UPI00386C762E
MVDESAQIRYRLVQGLMIAAGVLYCSLLLELAAGFPISLRNSMLSDLGALDQPTSLYARGMDLTSGILLVVAAVLARSAARIHRQVAALLISAALLGIGTMFTVFLPLDCAPSLSRACLESENGGRAGFALLLHATFSTVAGVGCVSMAVCVLLILRRTGLGGRRSLIAAAMAGATLVTQIWLVIAIGLQDLKGDDAHQPGIIQRVSVVLVCLMMATVAPGLKQALTRSESLQPVGRSR